MADALDFFRQDALRKRIDGIAGGNRVLWRDKDLPILHDYYMSARPEQIIRAVQPAEPSSARVDLAGLAKMGIEARSEVGADDHPLFIISTPRTDLANDSVDTANVDVSDFAKNSPVLDAHDSCKPPVAVSTRPFLSGSNLLAIAKFPQQGISPNSDQIAAAVRARLLKGASIGFIPLKWSFSTDPARPLGVNFSAIKILEWSICAVPCNPDCLLIGSVSGSTSSPKASGDAARAARIEEVQRMKRRAGALLVGPAATDIRASGDAERAARMEEVRRIRRRAGLPEKHT